MGVVRKVGRICRNCVYFCEAKLTCYSFMPRSGRLLHRRGKEGPWSTSSLDRDYGKGISLCACMSRVVILLAYTLYEGT